VKISKSIDASHDQGSWARTECGAPAPALEHFDHGFGRRQLVFQRDDAHRRFHRQPVVDQFAGAIGPLEIVTGIAAMAALRAVRVEQAGRLGRPEERRVTPIAFAAAPIA